MIKKIANSAPMAAIAPHIKRHAPHAEHMGFVAYALCEVGGAGHAIIYAVSAWLAVTGILVMLAFDFASKSVE
jgi:hypothetical protein